jgi:hypothetical protein
MKYEIPELTSSTSAIDAIQGIGIKNEHTPEEGPIMTYLNEAISAYQDWE